MPVWSVGYVDLLFANEAARSDMPNTEHHILNTVKSLLIMGF